jgi:hypothetical protein
LPRRTATFPRTITIRASDWSAQHLISQLNEFCRDKKFRAKTNLGAIVEALIERALDGDIDAIRERRGQAHPGAAD